MLIAIGVTAIAPFVQPVLSVAPYTMRFAGILAAAIAWLWALAVDPASFQPNKRILFPGAAVAAAIILSALMSDAPGAAFTFGAEDGLMAAPSWLSLLLVFLLAASVRPSRRVVGALKLLFLWGAASALTVIWQYFSSAPQITGGFGNGNYAGTALVTLLPLALFYGGIEANPRLRPWWRYLVLAMIAAVVLSGSIAVYVALVVAALGVCLFEPASMLGVGRRTAARIAIVIALAASVVVGVFAVALTTDALPDRTDSYLSERVLGTTVYTRVEMWKMAAAIFADNPVLGVGPDGLQNASQAYLTERLVQLESGSYADYRVLMKDPHSLPLLVLAGLGLLGTAALLVLAARWFATLHRATMRDAADVRARAFRSALAVSTMAYLTAMLFMPWAVSFGPLFPLLAGIAIAGASTPAEQPRRSSSQLLKLAAAGVATVAGVALVAAAAYGDIRVAAAIEQQSPELARAQYAAAARVQPTRPYVAYEALYAQGFLASDGLADLAAYRDAVDSAPKAVLRNAGFLANLVQPSLDEAYFSGRTDLAWEAERVRRAAAMAPNHPEVVLEQAHLALLSGDREEAARLLERTQRMTPNAPRHLLYGYYLALASNETSTAQALEPRIRQAGPGYERLAVGWNR